MQETILKNGRQYRSHPVYTELSQRLSVREENWRSPFIMLHINEIKYLFYHRTLGLKHFQTRNTIILPSSNYTYK